jgi:AraC-like DNA-binding protein
MHPPAADPSSHRLDAQAIRFSSDTFSERERIAAWREFVGRGMLKLDFAPAPGHAFHAQATMRVLPGLGVVSGAFTAMRIDRNLMDSDDLVMCISRCGEVQTTVPDREATIAAGDAIVVNADKAGSMVMPTGSRLLGLRIARTLLTPAIAGLDDAICRRIPAETPALRLLTAYLGVLEDPDTLATTELQRHAATHIQDLIALTVGATREAADIAAGRGARAARLRAIKQDIVDNLKHDLTVAAVGARHGCTPRYVQRLFESEGTTFTDYVLEQRLARTHRALTDPRRAHEKINAIAFDAGFAELSYFNRAFRRRFGAAPSDVRVGHGVLN